MDPKKLKVGRQVIYRTSRKREGIGKISDIESKATGWWVTVNDAAANRYVKVRPSQVKYK